MHCPQEYITLQHESPVMGIPWISRAPPVGRAWVTVGRALITRGSSVLPHGSNHCWPSGGRLWVTRGLTTLAHGSPVGHPWVANGLTWFIHAVLLVMHRPCVSRSLILRDSAALSHESSPLRHAWVRHGPLVAHSTLSHQAVSPYWPMDCQRVSCGSRMGCLQTSHGYLEAVCPMVLPKNIRKSYMT